MIRDWCEDSAQLRRSDPWEPDSRVDQHTEAAMKTQVRDRIVVESEKVGRPPREGDVLEVIETSYGTTYRVAWDDGHESTFHPSAGSARIVSAAESAAKPK
jgi:hypothetical protein